MSTPAMVALALVAIAGILLAVAARWRDREPIRTAAPRALPAPADVPHALYNYRWAGTARRRYVGISSDPETRHRRRLHDPRDQWWLLDTDGVMYVVRWYPNYAEAHAAEVAAIGDAAMRGEDPANINHNPLRRRVRRVA